MASSPAPSAIELFRAWRSGDAQAGHDMAQRFADWYYAIAVSRLGEARGRQPSDSARAAFGQGVVNVTEPRNLVGWAHGLIVEQVTAAGERATDGDEQTAYTGGSRPKALLRKARAALPAEVALLEACYSATAYDEAEVERLAGPLGGNPLGILKARYAIKKWLRDQEEVPFNVAPDEPVLDRAPLPLYEANRMASRDEEGQFEQWMLTDIDLCRDIAEFASFSIALRGGLDAAAAPSAGGPSASTDDGDAPAAGGGNMGLLVGGVVIGLLVLGGLAAAAFLMGG